LAISWLTTADGGPIGLVENGDIITIDAQAGMIGLEVFEEVPATRRTAWKPRKTTFNSGAIAKYAKLVGPAHLGTVTHEGAASESHVCADI
jgi:dihydroxy-acid dehydratase